MRITIIFELEAAIPLGSFSVLRPGLSVRFRAGKIRGPKQPLLLDMYVPYKLRIFLDNVYTSGNFNYNNGKGYSCAIG